LWNINTHEWDAELLEIFGLNSSCLAQPVPNAHVYGLTQGLDFLPDGIVISGAAGDQQAALFGQRCWKPGDTKCTFGTGSFLLMNTGKQKVGSRHGLLSTLAWNIGDEVTYALEGSSFIAGAAVQWLRDGLGLIKHASDIESLALSVPDSGGIYFIPALSGLGCPYWQPEARGLFWGITRGTQKGHMARAVLEGIAFQQVDILHSMEADSGMHCMALRTDGGASKNNLLMQFQANVLAALGSKQHTFKSLAKITWPTTLFKPKLKESDRQIRLAEWRSVVDRSLPLSFDSKRKTFAA
jgi:glycerol kinase